MRRVLRAWAIWSPDLVVVAIDEESARHLVVKVPTPRDYLARLGERVAAYRPRVIGIDILLDRPTEAKADWQLAQALRRASKGANTKARRERCTSFVCPKAVLRRER